jgi:hypothetical protein
VPPLQPYIHRNPSGNSCASCCPKEEWIIRSAVKSSPHSRLPSLQQAHRGSPLRLRLLWRMAEEGCSATTLPRRRHEWIEAGVMDALERIALASKAIGSSACRWPFLRRLLYREGSVRGPEGGQKPGGQGEGRHQRLHHGGRQRHTSGDGRGGRQPSPFTAFGCHPRCCTGGFHRVGRACQRPSRSGL